MWGGLHIAMQLHWTTSITTMHNNATNSIHFSPYMTFNWFNHVPHQQTDWMINIWIIDWITLQSSRFNQQLPFKSYPLNSISALVIKVALKNICKSSQCCNTSDIFRHIQFHLQIFKMLYSSNIFRYINFQLPHLLFQEHHIFEPVYLAVSNSHQNFLWHTHRKLVVEYTESILHWCDNCGSDVCISQVIFDKLFWWSAYLVVESQH